MDAKAELAAERRRISAGSAALAVITTGIVAAAIIANPRQFHPHANLANAFLVAVGVMCAGAALAGVIRLLSAAVASVGQWLRRYCAGVVLMAPAGLDLTGRFNAGWDVADCGTLVDRNRRTTAGTNFQYNCAAAAHHVLIQMILWAAVGCLVAVAYGLWLRRRRRSVSDPLAEPESIGRQP